MIHPEREQVGKAAATVLPTDQVTVGTGWPASMMSLNGSLVSHDVIAINARAVAPNLYFKFIT